MKPHAAYRSVLAGALLALSGALSAGAASIDDEGLAAPRSAWATRGSGIADMVMESIQHETAFEETADLELVDIALDRILTTHLVDPFSDAATASPAAIVTLLTLAVPHYRVPYPELLMAPGTSTISVAGTKKLGPWDLVPDESGQFLQVALAMAAFGFVPATLRRRR